MDKIAVLIPCYNEEKTIEKVVSDAKQALPEAVIYVYDNPRIEPWNWPGRPELLYVMKESREKETLSEECFGK